METIRTPKLLRLHLCGLACDMLSHLDPLQRDALTELHRPAAWPTWYGLGFGLSSHVFALGNSSKYFGNLGRTTSLKEQS